MRPILCREADVQPAGCQEPKKHCIGLSLLRQRCRNNLVGILAPQCGGDIGFHTIQKAEGARKWKPVGKV